MFKQFDKKENLLSVEEIEITTIIDNYTDDILSLTEAKSNIVTRSPVWLDGLIPPAETLLAEHGLSLLIKVKRDMREYFVLFDCGRTGLALLLNMKVLKIDSSKIGGIVLSHGHDDHFGGLISLLKEIPEIKLPFLAHPDAFRHRYREMQDGRLIKMPYLEEERLKELKLEVVKTKSPYLLCETIATTGEVERSTDFEGPSVASERRIERDGKIEDDKILDDMALVLHLVGKGLVVITGCAHAGTINTIRQAQRITGVNKIHAILGGFHLTGRDFEERTERTLQEFKEIKPSIIVPMHCNNWKAINRIAQEMPEAFILNTVGTQYAIKSC